MRKSIIICLLCSVVIATAQQSMPEPTFRHRIGLYGAYTLNIHQANFLQLPNCPTCSQEPFTGGTGSGFLVGGLYEIPFSRALALSLRASYTTQHGTLDVDEPTAIPAKPDEQRQNIPHTTATDLDAVFHHTINAQLANIGFEPALLYKPFQSYYGAEGGLILSLGARIGFVMQKTFEQPPEVLQAPDGSTIPVRNTTSYGGDIPGASALFAAGLLGIGYDIPLQESGSIFLTPEISYSFALTPVVSDIDWKVHQLRIGLALKFTRPERKEPVEEVPPPPENPPVVVQKEDPPQVPPSVLKASIHAVAVENDGREFENITYRVEEFLSDNLRPLLPYIFFEEKDHIIPERYELLKPRDLKNFHVDKLHSLDVIATYRHLLNIVGARMVEYNEATLTITGCNDFYSSEKGDLDLSYRRAESVRNYLSQVWGINKSRLKIEARNLSAVPTVASTQSYQNEVNQENRRVELFSEAPEILEPVRTADTVRVVSPPILRFKPEITASDGVFSWSIKATQNKKVLKEFLGNGGEPPPQLDWEIARQQTNVPRAPLPMEYTLTVTDNKGRTTQSAIGKTNVEQITIQHKRRERKHDKVIDRYCLILFDFDKATITEAHQRIISYIKKQIQPNSTVKIVGYTDYTNPLEYSQRLSKARAEATETAMGLTASDVQGLGKTVLLYDNKYPEGRFYCRTVTIVVETPLFTK